MFNGDAPKILIGFKGYFDTTGRIAEIQALALEEDWKPVDRPEAPNIVERQVTMAICGLPCGIFWIIIFGVIFLDWSGIYKDYASGFSQDRFVHFTKNYSSLQNQKLNSPWLRNTTTTWIYPKPPQDKPAKGNVSSNAASSNGTGKNLTKESDKASYWHYITWAVIGLSAIGLICCCCYCDEEIRACLCVLVTLGLVALVIYLLQPEPVFHLQTNDIINRPFNLRGLRGGYFKYCGHPKDSLNITAYDYGYNKVPAFNIDGPYTDNKTGCTTVRYRGYATIIIEASKPILLEFITDPYLMTIPFMITAGFNFLMIFGKIWYNIRYIQKGLNWDSEAEGGCCACLWKLKDRINAYLFVGLTMSDFYSDILQLFIVNVPLTYILLMVWFIVFPVFF